MIITCPSCKTQYTLPDTAIGVEGKKVKCVKCQHIWMQAPLSQPVEPEKLKQIQKPPEQLKPVPIGSNLPTASKKPVSVSGFLYARFVCYIIMALFMAILANRNIFPQLSFIYDKLGLQNSSGLVFENFTTGKVLEDSKLKFMINGDIVNNSSESRKIPEILATVYSPGENVLNKYSVQIPVTILEPGDKLHISPVIDNVSGNAERIVLDMGNKWELMLR